MSITTEAKTEVQRLLQQQQKVQAIKYLCDTFGISLQESKILVEAAEMELSARAVAITNQTSSTSLSGPLKHEVTALLQINKKIEAVKRVKSELNTSLKEALVLVEEVDKETNPNYRSVNLDSGCLRGGLKAFAVIFGLIGVIFLGIVGIIYYLQNQTINNSITTSGIVVDFRIQDGSGSAPVISYQLNSEKKLYYSSTYSTPSAYDLNEEVSLFINRSDPDDVIVDTFSDRWLLITIFGGIGSFFLLFCALFMFAGRKF
jgi:ribosomal protein L7/L12